MNFNNNYCFYKIRRECTFKNEQYELEEILRVFYLE